jgi:hypothetical protein
VARVARIGFSSRLLSECRVPSLPYLSSISVWDSFSRSGFDTWFHRLLCNVCQCSPIVEHYYSCLTCEGELHIRPSPEFTHAYIYIAQFDVCASCYTNEGPSTIEIEHHRMDHAVVRWTLNPWPGQRQWVESEAEAVLEDLRTNVWVYDDGGEAGEVPPFPDDETMENMNQDPEETEASNQAKDEDDEEEGEEEGEGVNEEEEEQEEEEQEEEEQENEEEGGDIAAAAAEFRFDVDETDGAAGELPIQDYEIMEYPNEDAEETETGDKAKGEDNSVDGGEEVVQVQDSVAPPRSYTCGRCSEGIDLDSTFYRCIGHSCRGAFTPQSSIF